tara:strand:+ start:927 stop:1295 length:369 start_codon:yes stop_codon:yes gene_type:complete
LRRPENLVYFPTNFGEDRANSMPRLTDARYAEGDANEGAEPLIYPNVYTNAILGTKARCTSQYALVSLANNAGEIKTIGTVTINGDAADLVSAEKGSDAAFAILQLKGADTSGLYSNDLESG